VVMVPSPSLSNKEKASLNSAICSSVSWSAMAKCHEWRCRERWRHESLSTGTAYSIEARNGTARTLLRVHASTVCNHAHGRIWLDLPRSCHIMPNLTPLQSPSISARDSQIAWCPGKLNTVCSTSQGRIHTIYDHQY
jgi:hypothetical protein